MTHPLSSPRSRVVAPVHRSLETFRLRWLALVLTLLGVASGCDSPPRAPSLRNGPVYHNKAAGFRFLVPDGWSQMASSHLPDSAIEKELCLTQFRVPSTGGASLEVLCFERDFVKDLARYHAEPSQGVKDWQLDGDPSTFDVEGGQGRRLSFSAAGADGQPRVKDVVYFERGGRVFSFVAVCSASDPKAREELQRAVRSLVWAP